MFLHRRALEKVGWCRVVRREERRHFGPERSVVAARVHHERVAVITRTRERGLQDVIDRMPAFGRHRRRSGVSSSLELPAQPHARDLPLAPNGRERDAQRFGGFRHAEAREVAELHEPSFLWIERGEARERVVEREKIDRIQRRLRRRGRTLRVPLAIDGAERDLHRRGAALEGMAPACMVHENAPHDLRGDGKELRAALPSRVVLRVEAEPGFVHKRGGLQRMSFLLAAQRESRLPAQLA